MKKCFARCLVATLALACGLAVAAPEAGHITEAQLRQVKVGQREEQVLKLLGKPLESPGWMDGSHSRVYLLDQTNQLPQRIYVDVDASGQVLDIQTGAESDE